MYLSLAGVRGVKAFTMATATGLSHSLNWGVSRSLQLCGYLFSYYQHVIIIVSVSVIER